MDVVLDLSGADLAGADIKHACLDDADLKGAVLTRADLRGSSFISADMRNIRLDRAQLTDAQLIMANMGVWVTEIEDSGLWLSGSLLEGADLRRANLIGANFTSANLDGVDFADATMYLTVLCDLDLSKARGLDAVHHEGLSYIGMETLLLSGGKIPNAFLRGCGLPETAIQNLAKVRGSAPDFYTCFISYADEDGDFSLRLYRDLWHKGIDCWRWKDDARWGRDLTCQVDEAIRRYDKLVVILSKDALKSEPVVREIMRAIQKEQRESKEVLFPITLDDAVFSWENGYQADLTRKYVGDFKNWSNLSKYDESLARLIRDLRREPETDAARGESGPDGGQ